MTRTYHSLLILILGLLIQGGASVDMGDLDDVMNNVEDVFGDVGDFFENLDISSWAEDQLDAFNNALSDMGDFSSDQIDKINEALKDGGVDSLDSLEGFTEEQINSVKEALKDADSASGKVAVGVVTFVAVVACSVLI